MEKNFKTLEFGATYRARNGDVVTIVKHSPSKTYPFIDMDNNSYLPNGVYSMNEEGGEFDLVEKLYQAKLEQPAIPKKNFEKLKVGDICQIRNGEIGFVKDLEVNSGQYPIVLILKDGGCEYLTPCGHYNNPNNPSEFDVVKKLGNVFLINTPQSDFKGVEIDEPGIYRMRNGETIEIPEKTPFNGIGNVAIAVKNRRYFLKSGRSIEDSYDYDIVEKVSGKRQMDIKRLEDEIDRLKDQLNKLRNA